MADDGDEKAKRLANEIRGSTESTEFELAGYGAEQCDRLAAAAFSKPLPLSEMIRLSFVVGGGKKVRQKYNDGLPTLWAEALKKVGFKEDRGASLDVSCAGVRRTMTPAPMPPARASRTLPFRPLRNGVPSAARPLSHLSSSSTSTTRTPT
jgi:hypothetical protein